MRITSFINNAKCIEWDLNMQQGALFDLLNQLHTWAEPISIDGEIYYWASKQMICSEIPLAYNKVDTVYRALKLLSDKGLINYRKHGEKDCISLTQKGKEWNSEINPTYKNTNINNTKISNIKKINKKDLDFSALSVPAEQSAIDDFISYRKQIRKPLTQSAVNALVRELNKAIALGHNPTDLIELTLSRGWQSFQLKFIESNGFQVLTNGKNQPVDRHSTGWVNKIGEVL